MKIRWLDASSLLEPDPALFWPDSRLTERVTAIIERVAAEGDGALLELAATYDGVDPASFSLEVTAAEWSQGLAQVPLALQTELARAEARISQFHRHTLPADVRVPLAVGFVEQVWVPLSRVGLYIPGGRTAYPSSVLMTAVPARAAGVTDLIVCTPPRGDGTVSPLVLWACRLAQVQRIFKVGGAGAVAAMALGTPSVPVVDKIAGPGNAYVNEAKRQLFGKVGIDCLAGPSELVLLADATAQPQWVAADLLAQAEHGSGAWSLLVCLSVETAHAIIAEVKAQATQDWHIDVTVAEDAQQAVEIINHLSPEHAHIMTATAAELAQGVYNAGAVFIGDYSPVASGDYAAGPSHVLPTGGSPRFMSGLGVTDFMKRINRVRLEREELVELAPTVTALAEAEGLWAHARSVQIRLK